MLIFVHPFSERYHDIHLSISADMLKLAILLVAAAVAMAIVPAPTFPTDWTAQEEDEIAIAQGSSPGPDGAMCCPAKSNCKVQTEYQAGQSHHALLQPFLWCVSSPLEQ